MRLLVSLTAALVLASCGSPDKEAKKPVVTEEAAKAKAAELPSTVLVRVPVDASGKEVHDKAELRTINAKTVSGDSVAASFERASAPDQVVNVDELDASSSTESFCGWRRWRRCTTCGHANQNYNYNVNYNYNNNGAWNWAHYAPAYYNYGYYYGYNYSNTFNQSGYNYYQYNSNFNGSYSGYGQFPTQAVPY
jgi:hypothetical protein